MVREEDPAPSVRRVFWRRVQGHGLERCDLVPERDGWILRGSLLTVEDDGPAQADYEVRCDALWATREARVTVRDAAGDRSLHLVSGDGCWLANGVELPGLRGAVDVDLQWTPSTNTLPLRRLELAPGAASGPVIAAWVRFPDLKAIPLGQSYERLDHSRYLYSSREGAFTAHLTVDADKLVIDYGSIWYRVGAPGIWSSFPK